jgi:probable rRNA maturation factor
MKIQIYVQAKLSFQQWRSTVQRACKAALSQQGIEEASLAVVLTDESTIHQMNMQYAGEDQGTDVLSFSSDTYDPDSGLRYLGDILIAVPVAEQQSVARGHGLGDELSLLAVHGTLHLLGYDHGDQETSEQMWQLQEQILGQLGIEDMSWEGKL